MTWESEQFAAIQRQLTDIQQMLRAVLYGEKFIINLEEKIMSIVDDTATDVAAQTAVIDGAVTLIQGLSAALAAAGTDPAKLAALKTSIDANTAKLAAAVLAGTPTPIASSPPVTPAAAATAAAQAVAP